MLPTRRGADITARDPHDEPGVCATVLHDHLLVVATWVLPLGDLSKPRCDLLSSRDDGGICAGGLSGRSNPPFAPQTPQTATRSNQWAHGATPCRSHASAYPPRSGPRAASAQPMIGVWTRRRNKRRVPSRVTQCKKKERRKEGTMDTRRARTVFSLPAGLAALSSAGPLWIPPPLVVPPRLLPLCPDVSGGRRELDRRRPCGCQPLPGQRRSVRAGPPRALPPPRAATAGMLGVVALFVQLRRRRCERFDARSRTARRRGSLLDVARGEGAVHTPRPSLTRFPRVPLHPLTLGCLPGERLYGATQREGCSMAALPPDGIAAEDSSGQPPSMPAAMTASDGCGILRGRPHFPSPSSSLPSPTVELPPAVAYIEAIRRSMPPTQRLVTAEELAMWLEWRLVRASPTVSAWMAPVSPNEPADPTADILDDSLLAGLTALSLDAAYATESELRAVAAPSVKSTPPPVGSPAEALQAAAPVIPHPSRDGDLVDYRSSLYVPVHYDADAGLLCFAELDVVHAGFSQGWPTVHRGVLSTVTHESLVVGPHPGGLICAWWQSCANRAIRTAASCIFHRPSVSGGSASLLYSFRQVQVPADAVPSHASVGSDPPSSPRSSFLSAVASSQSNEDPMSRALAAYFSLAQGTYGTAQLPSPMLGGDVPCHEVTTGRYSMCSSPASMRQLLVAFAASRLRTRVRHVGPPRPPEGGRGGDDARGWRSADARPIAPRPGLVDVPEPVPGLRFPCPVGGCRYATSRRFNLGVHMRRVRHRSRLFSVIGHNFAWSARRPGGRWGGARWISFPRLILTRATEEVVPRRSDARDCLVVRTPTPSTARAVLAVSLQCSRLQPRISMEELRASSRRVPRSRRGWGRRARWGRGRRWQRVC